MPDARMPSLLCYFGTLVMKAAALVQVALQQADYVAWNLWASINNRPVLEFRYQHLGTMMTYGSSTGALALPLAVPEGMLSFCCDST
jgi:NADH dehydrogenase FAD-containing subunit